MFNPFCFPNSFIIELLLGPITLQIDHDRVELVNVKIDRSIAVTDNLKGKMAFAIQCSCSALEH
jgi:hypothetical protein